MCPCVKPLKPEFVLVLSSGIKAYTTEYIYPFFKALKYYLILKFYSTQDSMILINLILVVYSHTFCILYSGRLP